MNFGSLMALTLSAVSLSSTLCAQTNWQDFMPSLAPGLSTSPVLATLPQDVVIEPPASNVPADKARWSGRWRGWACRDQSCDTRLVVEKVNADGATILYAIASATQRPYTARTEAKFVGDELQGNLENGAKVAYRMRKSGDLEFHWQMNASWAAGILSRDTEDLSLKADALLAERIAKPGPDVPESCARFFGGWAGKWNFDVGPQRLWVVAIKADCTAQFSYLGTTSSARPNSFLATEIKRGALTAPCGNGGTCVFEVSGDEIYGNYRDAFGGRNSGVFQRIK